MYISSTNNLLKKYINLFLFCILLFAFFTVAVKVVLSNSNLISISRFEKVSYEKVIVTRGDTLWHLAKQYNKENKDVRNFIYKIKKVNNLSNTNIIPGQILLIPK